MGALLHEGAGPGVVLTVAAVLLVQAARSGDLPRTVKGLVQAAERQREWAAKATQHWVDTVTAYADKQTAASRQSLQHWPSAVQHTLETKQEELEGEIEEKAGNLQEWTGEIGSALQDKVQRAEETVQSVFASIDEVAAVAEDTVASVLASVDEAPAVKKKPPPPMPQAEATTKEPMSASTAAKHAKPQQTGSGGEAKASQDARANIGLLGRSVLAMRSFAEGLMPVSRWMQVLKVAVALLVALGAWLVLGARPAQAQPWAYRPVQAPAPAAVIAGHTSGWHAAQRGAAGSQ
ncbi:hypothetical protein WJX72_001581 [[Myrmecia] bisecta]|uniref:Uncharacterized protein n=1 Tax=[Myrmecia] bisecta TaxID=41462 RepID=A0AAW1Q6J5_9CHLO